MTKQPSHAEVYNDLDGEVVNVFRVLRDPVTADRLACELELTPWSRREFYDAYSAATDPIERARRTIVRCFMGFGTTSLRKNRTGFRSKAYPEHQTGLMDWKNYPPHIRKFTDRLRCVNIEERPAIEIIEQQDSEDTLFYCDPPYLQSTRTSIQCPSQNDRAYAHDLSDEDHVRLADVLHSVRGMVVLSGYPSSLYDEVLYRDWRRLEVPHLADGGRKRTEVVWMNAAAASRQTHPQLFEAACQ